MKTVLVPIEDHEQTLSMLSLAAVFARRFDASVDGVALRLAQFQAVGAEPIVAVTFPPLDETDSQALQRARARFDGFVRNLPSDGPRFRWRAEPGIFDRITGALGRVYDITVIGRPTSSMSGSRMTTLESALFDSGRPILIAPPTAPVQLGEHVVIAWNQSTEAAQTMTAALPVLKRAREVTILTIEGATVPGPSGDELKDYLAVHGVASRAISEKSGSLPPGGAILEATRRLGGDLLIKSAYTQSRLRQMIFGGATSHILAHADLPVFMAN